MDQTVLCDHWGPKSNGNWDAVCEFYSQFFIFTLSVGFSITKKKWEQPTPDTLPMA